MGICDKYLAHDRTITEKQVQVKVKVEKNRKERLAVLLN
jgi:hypothetical protein